MRQAVASVAPTRQPSRLETKISRENFDSSHLLGPVGGSAARSFTSREAIPSSNEARRRGGRLDRVDDEPLAESTQKRRGFRLAGMLHDPSELFELAGQVCKRRSLCLHLFNVFFGPQPIL